MISATFRFNYIHVHEKCRGLLNSVFFYKLLNGLIIGVLEYIHVSPTKPATWLSSAHLKQQFWVVRLFQFYLFFCTCIDDRLLAGLLSTID